MPSLDPAIVFVGILFGIGFLVFIAAIADCFFARIDPKDRIFWMLALVGFSVVGMGIFPALAYFLTKSRREQEWAEIRYDRRRDD